MTENILKTWITNGTKTPFYARKKFNIEKTIKKAEIAVCGLGQFNLYMNGKKVGDHVLDPAWTDYDKLVSYLVFDITDQVHKGLNVAAAEVGNGWYLMDAALGYSFHFPPFMPPNPNAYRPCGKKLVLAARMCITYEDGREDIMETDDTWKVCGHAIVAANCFGSEIRDGRKEIPGWNGACFDDAGWNNAEIVRGEDIPKGKLERQTIPAVRVIRTYFGEQIGEKEGRLIYDFSQNASGMLGFKVKGKAGDVIRAYPAEKLNQSGDIDQMAKNWLMIDVYESYTIAKDDVWEEFQMTFTYIGARFAAFEGTGDFRLSEVRLDAVSSAGEAAGTFWCDDVRYMQIYDLIEKSVEANMMSVHTDCPTIERFAWQEENHLMAPAIMYMKQVRLHWEKFLKDSRTAQHTASDYFRDGEGGKVYPGAGMVPSQAPCYFPNVLPVPGKGSFYDVIGWGSSVIIGTYWHYQFYGDVSVIKDNYEAGSRYFRYLLTKVNADGFINHGLGDWGNPAEEYAKENVETAFLYADARILSEFAQIIGKVADKAAFEEEAFRIKDNYNRKLLVKDAEYGYCYRVWEHGEKLLMTQSSLAMPLFWGMVPEEAKADVAANLGRITQEKGCLETGEVGLPYIIQTMAAYGMNERLSELILKEQHPSYYAFVRAGETTLGEYWEENPRSHCHDMLGHIAEWYYNGIAGIKPLEAGFGKVLVKPYMPPSVNEVKCSYASVRGVISVHMLRENGQISLQVEAAEGIGVKIDRILLE